MDNQTIFDAVINHLVKQGVQSRSEEYVIGGAGKCAYRNGAGLSCAVGCLISDEDYRENMDSDDDTTIGDVLNNHPHLPEYFYVHRDLLSDLQQLHDTFSEFSLNDDLFVENVEQIGKDHNLNYEHLINATTISSATV